MASAVGQSLVGVVGALQMILGRSSIRIPSFSLWSPYLMVFYTEEALDI